MDKRSYLYCVPSNNYSDDSYHIFGKFQPTVCSWKMDCFHLKPLIRVAFSSFIRIKQLFSWPRNSPPVYQQVLHFVHKDPQLFRVLSDNNSTHIDISYFSKNYSNIISHLFLSLTSSILPCGFHLSPVHLKCMVSATEGMPPGVQKSSNI